MTKNEFKEIHEVWVELKAIFDEIDALNAPAGMKGKSASDTYSAGKASAH